MLRLSSTDSYMIRRLFVKCGLSNNLEDSENHLVNIRGLEGYTLPKLEVSSENESNSRRGSKISQPDTEMEVCSSESDWNLSFRLFCISFFVNRI